MRRRQTGFSIIEIMVGVVIGMIAVLVIYQVFATSEGIETQTLPPPATAEQHRSCRRS